MLQPAEVGKLKHMISLLEGRLWAIIILLMLVAAVSIVIMNSLKKKDPKNAIIHKNYHFFSKNENKRKMEPI